MFKNLRKRINTVLPDIETIYTSTTSSTRNTLGALTRTAVTNDSVKSKLTPWSRSSAINFDAGCALLERNEKVWEELHAANEANAKKAANCDRVIETITDNINKSAIDLSDINVSLEAIPNLITTIGNCSTIMHELNAKCVDVEKQLFELEDLMEVLQLQEKQLDSKFEMAMFKERKLANLERVRQSLAVKHEDTVKETEKQMRALQLERQSVFQNAFESDLNYYKEVGKIPSKFLERYNYFDWILIEHIASLICRNWAQAARTVVDTWGNRTWQWIGEEWTERIFGGCLKTLRFHRL